MTKKERKEQEALRRLEVLNKKGLMKEVVEGFKKNQLYFSEYNGFAGALFYMDNAPDRVLAKIEELKTQGCLVYHATHEMLSFGECWDLLIITDEDIEKNEWGKGMREDFDNYGIQFAYVINIDIPEFSEFGSIQIRPLAGGLVRES